MMKSPSCNPCVLTNSPEKFNAATMNKKLITEGKNYEGTMYFTSIFENIHTAVVIRPKPAYKEGN